MVTRAEKALVAVQLKDLQTKLDASHAEIDSLRAEAKELGRVNEEIEKTAAANRAAWKILHEEKDSHIQFQTARADQLEEEKAKRVAELELQLEEAKTKAKGDREAAAKRIRTLMQRVEAQMHFAEVQTHLETELATLQQQRATEKRAFQKKYEEQDYQHLKAQKDLEARYDAKVKHLTAQMKGLSDSLMAETTKRTIVENIRLNKMIEDMSVNNKDLILEKEQMMVELLNLRQQKELLSVSEKVLAEKMNNARKVIKRLTDRVRGLEKASEREADLDEAVEDELVSLQEANVVLETSLAEADVARAEAEAALAKEVSHREALQREQDSFLSMLEEAAGFILACLQDVKQQLALERESREIEGGGMAGAGMEGGEGGGEGGGFSLAGLSPGDRERALEYLLGQLNALNTVHGSFPGLLDGGGRRGESRGNASDNGRPPSGPPSSSRGGSRGNSRGGSRGSRGSVGSGRLSSAPSDGRLSASIFRWATPSPSPGYRSVTPGGGGGLSTSTGPGGYGMAPARPPRVSVATQTMALSRTSLFDQQLTSTMSADAPSTSEEAFAYRQAVLGDVRPWGSVAKHMPLTKRSSQMFLRRRTGHGGNPLKPLATTQPAAIASYRSHHPPPRHPHPHPRQRSPRVASLTGTSILPPVHQ